MKIYYRAGVYGEDVVPYITNYYVVYSTNCYDFCVNSTYTAKLVEGKTNKEIRELCKQQFCSLKKIDKSYSKFARKTPEDAIKHLIARKQYRNRILKQYITENEQFINNAVKDGAAKLVLKSNTVYNTTYQVNNP